MEAAAKKFEQDGGILGEIHRQARSGDNFYSYPLLHMFQKAEADGYSPYCEIDFEVNPELSVTTQDHFTTQDHLQELECVADSQPMLSFGKESIRSETSEVSLSGTVSTNSSSVEPFEISPVPKNVRSSSLIAKCD